LKIVCLLGFVLGLMNYAVYAERRISALIQDRLGPNRVGPAGLLQPLADAGKFLLKEQFTPAHVNKLYYWLAPCLAMVPAVITIAVVPFGSTLFGVPMVIADINVGILFVFAIASLGVYGIVLGGWAAISHFHVLPRVQDVCPHGHEPAPVRFPRRRTGACRRLPHRICVNEVRFIFSRRIHRHDHWLGNHYDAVPWWLAFSRNS